MVRCAVLTCAAAWMLAAPAHANDAHSVADKFSEADKREADRKAEDARKREAEIKADKAREEAAARRAADALKADKEKADRAKRAKAQPAEAARLAAEQRKAEEADMLSRARREAEEMKAAEEARILAEQDVALERARAALRASQAAEQERAKADALAREAARGKPAVADVPDADAERVRVERARRAHATRRIVRQMQRAQDMREAALASKSRRDLAQVRQPTEAMTRPGDTDPAAAAGGSSLETASTHLDAKLPRLPEVADPAKTEPAKTEPVTADLRRSVEPRLEAGLRERVVTVLLVMAPGTYGIRRRGPKVADPVLCTHEGCYISIGAGMPAHFMPGRKALSFGNTWGARAGACRQKLGCIFRGVELGQASGFLQPVDLHILKHDRRQGQVINADSGCRVDAGRVACDRGIYAADYAMWVMPESMATALGAAALERALEDGLAAPRSADLQPRQMR